MPNIDYWRPEFGECSLNNPIVWKRLRYCVNSVISRTKWIHNKKFVEPDDILLQVQEDIKHLHPSMYGSETYTPIQFLIKKINTQVGRAWWIYLKENEPTRYDHLRSLQRQGSKDWYAKNGYSSQKQNRTKAQQKIRDNISESYLIQCVYHNLRNKTGMKYTADEIRKLFPDLIQKKRETIIKKRSYELRKPL